ncbi:uncharacterized protein [Watersipora subatra]|uniref:uncharacterized protein isoform X2 n=1 Tax=Watersipora subatra TaxID=2589382 RepID=UPI00355B2B0A
MGAPARPRPVYRRLPPTRTFATYPRKGKEERMGDRFSNAPRDGVISSKNNTVDRKEDVARLMIGKNRQRNTKGRTFINTNIENTWQDISRRNGKQERLNQGALHRKGQLTARNFERNANSPMFRATNIVEEKFKLIPPESNVRGTSLPRTSLHLTTWKNQHESSPRSNMNKASSENNGVRRRQTPYRSIQEYEEAQRSMTRSSNALHAVSSTENISPQLTLVMEGKNYSIQGPEANTFQRPTRITHSNVKRGGRGGLHIVKDGQFSLQKFEPTPNIRASSAEPRLVYPSRQISQDRKNARAVQLSNERQLMPGQIQVQSSGVGADTQPKYLSETHGKGKNFFKNEALEYDDDHKYFRQHGQRVKKTADGSQQLFLDKRLAETNDIIGDQRVQEKHSQKVQSGESVSANHHSKFHSEVKVSHKNNPQAEMRFQPGFERFFTSISKFGPDSGFPLSPNADVKDSSLQMVPLKTPTQFNTLGSDNDSELKSPTQFNTLASDNDSDASSIRSSASAYWPPELKFPSMGNHTNAASWKYSKPGMKLRRVSPASDKRR